MRILLLSNMFAPEMYASAPLNTEVCRYLAGAGHDVTVVTAFPHYPEWRVWDGYRGRVFRRERLDRIDVRRVWSYVPRKPQTLGRIMHYACFAAVALPASLTVPRPDVVLCVTPPLELGVTAWLLKPRWNAPIVLWIKDLVPEVAVQLGMLRNRWAVALARRFERFAYARADAIAVLCEGFREHVVRCGVAADRVHIVPDWIGMETIHPDVDGSGFRWSCSVGPNDLLVVHSGNVGLKQGLETVLDTARRLDDHGVVFAIVGDGAAKAALTETASRLRLRNVRFLPVQPWEVFPQVLAAADILLLHQRATAVETVIPSKLLAYMASGRPIVAAVHSRSESALAIERARCGVQVDAEQPELLAQAILSLQRDPTRRRTMGASGRRYVEEHHTRDRVLSQLNELLAATAAGRSAARKGA
jgi:colanic acid biosynthesis glycosyl transferase WcaI